MVSLKERLRSDKLFPAIVAGLVAGLIATLTDIIPMAAFVFSGNLEPFVATGIAINLFSSAIVGLLIALRSSLKGVIAFPLAEEMATLAVILSTVANNIPSSATPEETILTIIGAIALTSILVGIFLLIVGQLRLGEMIRFLPYPIVGGYLAGLGFLLSLGGFQVMADVGTIFQLPELLRPELLLKWLPGLALAIGLLILTNRYKHVLIIPVSFAAATSLFYLVLALTHTSIADAFQQRWLLGPFPEEQVWKPISIFNLAHINWPLILSQLPGMFALMLITALSILLVSSGIELVTEQDIDLDQELKAAGVANIFSGLLGGVLGSHTIGATLLAHKMGGNNRLAGVIVSGFYLVVLLAGLSLLSFFPRFIAGGALVFIGIPLILSWVYEGWFKLSRIDYAVMLLIAGVVVTVGFIEGIVLGLILAIALFVFQYSRVNITRYTLSGGNYLSRVQRSRTQERLLRQDGEQIQILQLQGFIFFGTAYTLLKQIRQRLSALDADPNANLIRFLVLDFRLVNGLDSSAMLSFLKLKQLAQQRSLKLIMTNLAEAIFKQFQHEGFFSGDDDSCKTFPSLNEGVIWCENQILEANLFRRRRTLPLAVQLESFFPEAENGIPTFMDYLEEINLNEGEYLFHQNEQPTALYFLEFGQMSIVHDNADGANSQRHETLYPGSIVGEAEFYARCAYKGSAIADKASTLHRLSSTALQQMQLEHPKLANQFSESMNAIFSERLVQAQTEIDILLK